MHSYAFGCRDCVKRIKADPFQDADLLSLLERQVAPLASEIARILRRLVAGRHLFGPVLLAFADRWMHEFSYEYRKGLSHLGICRCSHWSHLKMHQDAALGNAFDPGNWIYAMVLKLAFPEGTTQPWNDETLGDICEAWLAIGFRPQAPVVARHLALWIEDCICALWAVKVFKIFTLIRCISLPAPSSWTSLSKSIMQECRSLS